MRRSAVVLTCLAVALPGSASAQLELLHPDFVIVNQFARPPELSPALGDLMFGADGSTAFVLAASESSSAAVWGAPVVRDALGNVTAFGTFSLLFADPSMDTGLELAPGSDTLFYRSIGQIAQRRSDGATEYTEIVGYGGTFGGLAFIPPLYPNGGSLLSASFGDAAIFLHPVSDDGDGTFTVGGGVPWADLVSETAEIGDVEIVTSGPLAGSLLGASYDEDQTLFTLALDLGTGLPAGGATPSVTPFATGLSNGWGVSIDPVTGNIWLIRFAGAGPVLIQIGLPLLFEDGFESGDLSAWSATSP